VGVGYAEQSKKVFPAATRWRERSIIGLVP